MDGLFDSSQQTPVSERSGYADAGLGRQEACARDTAASRERVAWGAP
jgi:hypothetical protein